MECLERPFTIKGVLDKEILLSPLLFVLAADFLQSMINKAKDLGQLNLPIPTSNTRSQSEFQQINDGPN